MITYIPVPALLVVTVSAVDLVVVVVTAGAVVEAPVVVRGSGVAAVNESSVVVGGWVVGRSVVEAWVVVSGGVVVVDVIGSTVKEICGWACTVERASS